MIAKELTVSNAAGFHVRDASLVCKAAMKYSSKLTLAKNGYKAVIVDEKKKQEEQAAEAIKELFDRKFYEDEFAASAPADL